MRLRETLQDLMISTSFLGRVVKTLFFAISHNAFYCLQRVNFSIFVFSFDQNRTLCNSKGTRVEVYLVSSDGLKMVKEFGIYGEIACLEPFRPPVRSFHQNTRIFAVAFVARYLNTQLICHICAYSLFFGIRGTLWICSC